MRLIDAMIAADEVREPVGLRRDSWPDGVYWLECEFYFRLYVPGMYGIQQTDASPKDVRADDWALVNLHNEGKE